MLPPEFFIFFKMAALFRPKITQNRKNHEKWPKNSHHFEKNQKFKKVAEGSCKE